MTLVVSSIVSCINFLVIGVCLCHLLCMYVFFAIGWFLYLRKTRMCACVSPFCACMFILPLGGFYFCVKRACVRVCVIFCVYLGGFYSCVNIYFTLLIRQSKTEVCASWYYCSSHPFSTVHPHTHTVLERPPVTIGEPTSCGTTIGPFGGSDLSRAITDDVNRCLQQTQLHPGNEALHHPWSKLPVL